MVYTFVKMSCLEINGIYHLRTVVFPEKCRLQQFFSVHVRSWREGPSELGEMRTEAQSEVRGRTPGRLLWPQHEEVGRE